MATFTLAQAQLLGLDDLQAGIAETIVVEAPALALLPMTQVAGNAYTFNREVAHVSAEKVAADGTITDSDGLETLPVTVSLSAISGQSDIPNAQLRQRVGANGGNDLMAIHLKAAAKGVALKYQHNMINGTVASCGYDGYMAHFAQAAFAAQVEDVAGEALDFDHIDNAGVKLSGRPEYIMGNGKTEAKLKKLMRNSSGVSTIELNGVYFTSYDGVPFVRNDNMADGALILGSWGDGTDLGGATGLTTGGELFSVTKFDAMEGRDATRVRVIMDGAFTIFSPKKVALIKNFI